MKVAFLISDDVLVEVLSYFDRRQLTKFEWACRRFHLIVVRYFNEAPFLFFEMDCYLNVANSARLLRQFSKFFTSPYTGEDYCHFQSPVFISV